MENKKFLTLRRKSDFSDLRNDGRFLKASDWLLINYSSNDEGYFRPGWTVSRKVGISVVRNRLKRWGREFFKQEKTEAVDMNLIFRPKEKGFYKELSHAEFDNVLSDALRKIRKRL